MVDLATLSRPGVVLVDARFYHWRGIRHGRKEKTQMTPRERSTIRAIITALEGRGSLTMDSLMLSYGLPLHTSKPTKNRAAVLLQALVNDDRS